MFFFYEFTIEAQQKKLEYHNTCASYTFMSSYMYIVLTSWIISEQSSCKFRRNLQLPNNIKYKGTRAPSDNVPRSPLIRCYLFYRMPVVLWFLFHTLWFREALSRKPLFKSLRIHAYCPKLYLYIQYMHDKQLGTWVPLWKNDSCQLVCVI